MWEISKKVKERRLRCYVHETRREEDYVGRRVIGIEVHGKMRIGRPSVKWLDCMKEDL